MKFKITVETEDGMELVSLTVSERNLGGWLSWQGQELAGQELATTRAVQLTEYITLNCENCKKPVVKMSKQVLARIKEAMHFAEDQEPHFYHIDCRGGFET